MPINQTPTPTVTTPDQIRARAGIIASIASFDPIINGVRLFGFKPRYPELSSIQKKTFDNTHPVLQFCEASLINVRHLLGFMMMLSSVFMALPYAAVALGLFSLVSPYLVPILVIGIVCLLAAYVLEVCLFFFREYSLERLDVKETMLIIEALDKGEEKARLRINSLKNSYKYFAHDLSQRNELDPDKRTAYVNHMKKQVKTAYKDVFTVFDDLENSFLDPVFRENLLTIIAGQLESEKKLLKITKDQAKAIKVMEDRMCAKSVDHVIAHFVYFNENIQSFEEESKALFIRLNDLFDKQDIPTKKLITLMGEVDTFTKTCRKQTTPYIYFEGGKNRRRRSPRVQFEKLHRALKKIHKSVDQVLRETSTSLHVNHHDGAVQSQQLSHSRDYAERSRHKPQDKNKTSRLSNVRRNS